MTQPTKRLPKRRTNICLSDADRAAMNCLARAKGTTAAAQVRSAIADYTPRELGRVIAADLFNPPACGTVRITFTFADGQEASGWSERDVALRIERLLSGRAAK